MPEKDSHCSYCGQPFAPDQPWPRHCAACGQVTYRNPTPVAVVLLPVDSGLVVIRRGSGNERGVGQLGLPGGYLDYNETWQAGAARELFEETGLTIEPEELREVRVLSGGHATVLIFGLARPRALAELPPFQPNSEATERLIISRPVPLTFDTHTLVVREYFEGRFTS
jgi:ADP-ribose pyrophosphatase YjhB (NUDIX family)